MKNLNYTKTEPVNVPVTSRSLAPATEIDILETLYRQFGLAPTPAIRAAQSDYAMFRNGPPPEGNPTT